MNLRFLTSAIKGLLLAFASAAVLLFIFTFIALNKQDPNEFLTPLSIIALYVSSVLCGYATSRFHRSAHIPISLFGGILYSFSIFVLSFLFKSNVETGNTSLWYLYLLIPLCSSIGGVIASPKQKSLKKVKKRAIKRAKA